MFLKTGSFSVDSQVLEHIALEITNLILKLCYPNKNLAKINIHGVLKLPAP